MITVAVLVLATGLLAPVAANYGGATQNAANDLSSNSCFYRTNVQSGSTTSTANGLTTVTITAVDPNRSFLLFSTRHALNRPVGSEVTGRLAGATTLEFNRATNEASPATITIQWFVVQYNCGVSVQRGSVAPAAATTNVAISAVNSLSAAFVTWSKTPVATDSSWGSDDPVAAELTSTTNLQFRQDGANANHTIWWQVIEFTDATRIKVQKGVASLTGAATSTTATLATSVLTSRTFVLVGARSSGAGTDIGSGMVRARLTNSTTVTFDRGAANYNATEIAWQVIELKEGSAVQSGTSNFSSGVASATAALTAVDLGRTTAFASTQAGGGQTGGKTSYDADDIVGVACATVAMASATQLTLTRESTVAAADIAWSVVTWGPP